MTRGEYQELMQFPSGRFDRIDQRFEGMGQRFEGVDQRLRRVEVLVEENRGHIQGVAEGVTSLADKMDREFAAVRADMAKGFAFQGNLIRELSAQVDLVEARL